MQNLANHLDPLEDIQSHKVQNQNTEHSYGRQYVDKSDVLIQNALGATEVSKTK